VLHAIAQDDVALPGGDGVEEPRQVGRRVLAIEVMHVNQPIRSGIRFGKIESIESSIQTGKRDGMIPLDEDLSRLSQLGRITPDIARKFAKDPDAMK